MSGTPPHKREWIRRFAQLLREERESAGLQVEECLKGGNYQEECENRKAVPDLQYLVRLLVWFGYRRGHQIPPERLRRLLITWALARIESYLGTKKFRTQMVTDEYANEADTPLQSFDEVWSKYGEKVLTHVENTLVPIYEDLAAERRPDAARYPSGKLPTLRMFPDAFKPLTVVVGGYPGDAPREPEQLSELFRHGQSLVDLTFISRLGLDDDVRVVPDHLYLEMGVEERARQLGRSHLLLIGGPLVNSLTRDLILKKKLIFNYVYDKGTYRWEQQVYDHFKGTGLFNSPPAVRMLYRMLETPQQDINVRSEPFKNMGVNLEERERIRDIVLQTRRDLLKNLEANNNDVTEQFRPKEIFSPFRQRLFSCVADEHHDWGMVSIGENPWTVELAAGDPGHPRYTVVIAFGLHEIGTAQAVKALTQTEEMRRRPLGSILWITEARGDGPARITDSSYIWDTDPYEVKELLARIKHALEGGNEPDGPFSIFTRDELEDYKRLTELFLY